MKSIFILVALLHFCHIHAQSLNIQKAFGGSNNDYAQEIQKAAHNGYIMIGSSRSFNTNNSSDLYIVRIDSQYNIAWTKILNTLFIINEFGASICATADGGYVYVGNYDGGFSPSVPHIYLSKIDSMGNNLWSKSFAGGIATKLIATYDGGYLICGSSETFTTAYMNFYAIKTDANGTVLWAKNYGTTGYDFCNAVVQTSDSGFVLVGQTKSVSKPDYDASAIKIDKNGVMNWAKIYGDTTNNWAQAIGKSTNGKLIILGGTYQPGTQNDDLALMLIDSTGIPLWAKSVGGAGQDNGNSIINTLDGDYAICGTTNSFGLLAKNALIIKTTSNGQVLWGNTYGGTINENANSILPSSNGYVMVGTTQSFTGDADMYLVATDANGNSCQKTTQNIISQSLNWTTDTVTVSSGAGYNIIQDSFIVSNGGIATLMCNLSISTTPTGINNGITISPNPAAATLCLHNHTQQLINGIMEMRDAMGRVIFLAKNITIPENGLQVDIANLNHGLYFITIYNNTETHKFKFLKE